MCDMRQRWRQCIVGTMRSPRDFDYFRSVNDGLIWRKGGRKPPFFIPPLAEQTT